MLALRFFVILIFVASGLSASNPVDAEEMPIRLSSPWMPFKLPRFNAGDVERMKVRFAYVSLADRLVHDKPLRNGELPPLSAEAKAAIDAMDTPPPKDGPMSAYWISKWWGWPRVVSIQMLHNLTVDEFLQRDGLGFSRMLPPGPEYLLTTETKRIDVESAPPLSSEHVLERAIPLVRDALSALLTIQAPATADTARFPRQQSRVVRAV